MDREGQDRPLVSVRRRRNRYSTFKKNERKRECFYVVFKKMQATKDDIEKLQTGLKDLRYFQTQKRDCGALLYLHVFLLQHLAQS